MRDDNAIQFQDLDDVLHNAQLRRSADLVGWLSQYFRNRQTRPQNKDASLPSAAQALAVVPVRR
jgi:hypothetical protein